MFVNFADRLLNAISRKRNPSCVGLDPRIGNIPEHVRERATRCYGNGLEAAANAGIYFCALKTDGLATNIRKIVVAK